MPTLEPEKNIEEEVDDTQLEPETPIIDEIHSESDSESSLGDLDNESRFANIVEIKESSYVRRDNVAYLISSNGKPCDEDCKILMEKNQTSAQHISQIREVFEEKEVNSIISLDYVYAVKNQNP